MDPAVSAAAPPEESKAAPGTGELSPNLQEGAAVARTRLGPLIVTTVPPAVGPVTGLMERAPSSHSSPDGASGAWKKGTGSDSATAAPVREIDTVTDPAEPRPPAGKDRDGVTHRNSPDSEMVAREVVATEEPKTQRGLPRVVNPTPLSVSIVPPRSGPPQGSMAEIEGEA